MPKTKFQELIFSIIMVFVMVYCMALYNIVLENGFSYVTFIHAFLGMWIEVIAAFIAQKFIVGPIAMKLAFKHFKPGVDKPIIIMLAISGFTVCFMAPIMSLFATILHNGFVQDLPLLWLQKLVQNFPFALCIQVFYVGPFVRFVFRTMFKKQLAGSMTLTPVNAVQEM